MGRLKPLSRIRHFRGHGIHSPFVYGLKRDVFMGKNEKTENIFLLNTLTNKGIRRKTAKELEKLHAYCNFNGFEFVDSKNTSFEVRNDILYIAAKASAGKAATRLLNENRGVAMAVLKGIDTGEINDSLTIIRKHYTLYFNGEGFSAQTFKL